MDRAKIIAAHPDFPWLAAGDVGGVGKFLAERGWLAADERVITCDRAGAGNMNLTLRVRTDRRSVILKQARPWVEKYDHIPAPWERMEFEQRFYERAATIPEVARRMPRLLATDGSACAVLIEDLGPAADATTIYDGRPLLPREIRELAAYLAALHSATRGDRAGRFENRAMRELNHEHLFVVPLDRANGVDLEALEPGLTAAANLVRDDEAFCSALRRWGTRYLAAGPVLVHGDFFPGSWLRTADGMRVIDAEFCFYGDPEIDVGCGMAHLALAAEPGSAGRDFWNAYRNAVGAAAVDASLAAGYAAVEIVRRLIGVAQLPMARGRNRRAPLLARARRALVEQSLEPLWT